MAWASAPLAVGRHHHHPRRGRPRLSPPTRPSSGLFSGLFVVARDRLDVI